MGKLFEEINHNNQTDSASLLGGSASFFQPPHHSDDNKSADTYGKTITLQDTQSILDLVNERITNLSKESTNTLKV